MPIFTSHPAMRVQTFSLPEVLSQAEDLRGRRSLNRLREMQIDEYGAQQERQAQFGGLLPQIAAGNQDATTRGLELDPEQTAQALDTLGKMDRREREAMKEKTAMLGNLALGVLTAPPVQRAAIWGQARESAIANGANPENVPEAYDQGTEQKLRMWVAKAGQVKTLMDQAETAAPTTREFKVGDKIVTRRWDSDAGQWNDVSTAPRFESNTTGGATPAQQANNAEIDAARQTLGRMNLDRAEILRRTQKSTNTGRENPDYDPSLERLVRTATQRKVGTDPKFNLTHRRYLGPAPEYSDPAGPKALPPGVSAEQPGILDRVGDYLFGDDDAPAPASSAGARRGGRAGVRPGVRPGVKPGVKSGTRPGTRPGVRGGTRPGTKAITKMSLSQIDDLVTTEGDNLSPAELKAVEARLAELGK